MDTTSNYSWSYDDIINDLKEKAGRELTEDEMLIAKSVYDRIFEPDEKFSDYMSRIPDYCKNCTNYAIYGGSGVCHCILGSMPTM